jgi:hypothetical protein
MNDKLEFPYIDKVLKDPNRREQFEKDFENGKLICFVIPEREVYYMD